MASRDAAAHKAASSDLLLGIDLGTSACKAAVFDLQGHCVAQTSRSYPLLTPSPGRVEQDPEDWWSKTADAIRELTSIVGPDRIAGIGVCGQSGSAVPVTEAGEVLAHTPIWMDTSTSQLCSDLAQKIDLAELLRICGNPLHSSYSTPKIIFTAREQPDLYRRTDFFLQSNSFIGLRLTGAISQDLCQSYGLHVFNTATGHYDEALADIMGIDLRKLPTPVDCHQVIGTVTPEASAQTGLRTGIPVVAGGLDAACSTLGAGVYRPGDVQEQGGQAGGMSIVTDHPISDPRLLLSRHVVPKLWLLQGGTVAGGASLQWAFDQLGYPGLDFDQVNREAGQVPAGSQGLWYLPYLAGERSPLWDPSACGVFFGLKLVTTRAAIFRAVMEGVAYSLLDNLTVASQAGAECAELFATGGAASSPLWTQIKADVTGRVIKVPDAKQTSTLGAALLAGVGVGAYAGFDDAVAVTGQIRRTHIPGDDHQVYAAGFPVYRRLYQQLKPLMAETSLPVEKGNIC